MDEGWVMEMRAVKNARTMKHRRMWPNGMADRHMVAAYSVMWTAGDTASSRRST